MKNIQKVVQDYEDGRLSLEEFQELIWGLSECALEMMNENQIGYYLAKI